MKRSKFSILPPEVQQELIVRAAQSNFSGYEQIEAWLKGRGFDIGKSSIHRALAPYDEVISMVQQARFVQAACAEKMDLGVALLAVSVMSFTKSVEGFIDAARRANQSDGHRL